MSGRAGSPGPSARRELSIDFFVGSARSSIFVDRVPGDALSHFQPRNLGFSSAAGMFVSLAGAKASG